MSEHTKGPWVSGWNQGLTGPRTPSAGGPTCAGRGSDNWFPVSRGMDCVAIAVGDSADEAQANARLIAAAPELLEAAKAAVVRGCYCHHSSMDDWHSESCPIPALRAAIAKATTSAQAIGRSE